MAEEKKETMALAEIPKTLTHLGVKDEARQKQVFEYMERHNLPSGEAALQLGFVKDRARLNRGLAELSLAAVEAAKKDAERIKPGAPLAKPDSVLPYWGLINPPENPLVNGLTALAITTRNLVILANEIPELRDNQDRLGCIKSAVSAASDLARDLAAPDRELSRREANQWIRDIKRGWDEVKKSGVQIGGRDKQSGEGYVVDVDRFTKKYLGDVDKAVESKLSAQERMKEAEEKKEQAMGEEKQSIIKAAANTAAGQTFGAVTGAVTGGAIWAIPGAVAGAAIAGFSGGSLDVGLSALAGAGITGAVGAAAHALTGGIAGAVAGFMNSRPRDNSAVAHQQELARVQAASVVQGMQLAGAAMAQAQIEELGERQDALAAQQQILWQKSVGGPKRVPENHAAAIRTEALSKAPAVPQK